MTETQKLQKIRARCVELLETSKKQTLEEWTMGDETNFIAACAGAAEAGWRSTITAIDRLLEGSLVDNSYLNDRQASEIIKAWDV